MPCHSNKYFKAEPEDMFKSCFTGRHLKKDKKEGRKRMRRDSVSSADYSKKV